MPLPADRALDKPPAVSAANVIEEVRHPRRDYPRALFGALLTAEAVYVLVGLASSIALPADELSASSAAWVCTSWPGWGAAPTRWGDGGQPSTPRPMTTRMISFVPSRIWCTRRSRTTFSMPYSCRYPYPPCSCSA